MDKRRKIHNTMFRAGLPGCSIDASKRLGPGRSASRAAARSASDRLGDGLQLESSGQLKSFRGGVSKPGENSQQVSRNVLIIDGRRAPVCRSVRSIPAPSRYLEIKHLYREAARLLAGRPVQLIWEDPEPGAPVLGRSTVRNGQAIVWVSPNLPSDLTFRVLLHELGHLAVHGAAMDAASRLNRRPSLRGERIDDLATVIAHEAFERGSHELVERQADELADRWESAARRAASGAGVYEQLQALIRLAVEKRI